MCWQAYCDVRFMATSVTVIGCSDAFSSGGRANACFLVRSTSMTLLVDCGATSLTALKKHGIPVNDIDAVIISHFHGDHFGGLPFLTLDAAMHQRSRHIGVITPPGGRQKLQAAMQLLYPGTHSMSRLDIDYAEFDQHQKLMYGAALIESFPVIHTRATLPHGLRLTVDGVTIGYSGDTAWTDELPRIAAGADLFICECTFYDREMRGHLSYNVLREHIGELNCRRLLLTHMGEEMLARADSVEHDCAYEGLEIRLGTD